MKYILIVLMFIPIAVSAAVPAGVTTSLTDVGIDIAIIATAVFLIIIIIEGFKYMRMALMSDEERAEWFISVEDGGSGVIDYDLNEDDFVEYEDELTERGEY